MAKRQLKSKAEDGDEASADPLGKLIERYHVSVAGVVFISGFVALVGLGLAGYGLLRGPVSVTLLVIGLVVVVMAGGLLVVNMSAVGRRLEVRKRGLRFVAAGSATEMFWEEIAEIDVRRSDDTYLGVVGVRKRSSDATMPSGPLTTTEWDVTILANDGRTIRLDPTFLKNVPNARQLIHQLRLRSRC